MAESCFKAGEHPSLPPAAHPAKGEQICLNYTIYYAEKEAMKGIFDH